jgi:hypothetical protein
MDKLTWQLLLLLFSIFVWVQPSNAQAEAEGLERQEVFSLLEEAYDAQVSLSDKGRSMAEIEGILDTYFTENYMSLFINENVVGQENQYQTYGTDFAPYYIPFYGFSEKTKVENFEDAIYVLEYFPGNGEGPVSYQNHYEALKLVNENGSWKVSEYLYDSIPEDVIKEAYPDKVKETADIAGKKVSKSEENHLREKLAVGPNFSSFRTFIEYGVMFGSETKTLLFGFF